MMFQWLRQHRMLPVTLFGFGLQQHMKKRRLSSSRHDSLHQPFEIAVSKLLQYSACQIVPIFYLPIIKAQLQAGEREWNFGDEDCWR